MVVDDFHVVRAVRLPTEADAPLVVDSDAPRSLPVAVERLEPVPGRDPERFHPDGRVQHVEFSQRDAGKRMELAAIAVPRERFGIGGGLEIGAQADIAVIDPDVQGAVEPDKFLSKGRATPFAGMKTQGDIVLTMHKGHIVYRRV